MKNPFACGDRAAANRFSLFRIERRNAWYDHPFAAMWAAIYKAMPRSRLMMELEDAVPIFRAGRTGDAKPPPGRDIALLVGARRVALGMKEGSAAETRRFSSSKQAYPVATAG